MKMCDIHPDRPAVLISGKNLCVECTRKEDAKTIITWAIENHRDLHIEKIVQICRGLFDFKEICFANFRNLYSILPRGVWCDQSRTFAIPQKEYFQSVFDKYLKEDRL